MNNGWNCLWWGHPVQATDHLMPLCHSYALAQATIGIGTVLIWNLVQFGTKCSAAT